MAKLTPKQKMFCKEYLVDLNMTQAAIRAGYSKKTARSIGQENLTKPVIMAEIQRLMDKRAKRIEITADKVLQELAKLAFANMQDYVTISDDGCAFVDFSKLTREQAAAIQEIHTDEYVDAEKRTCKKIKFKIADKKANLELLGRNLELFTDVHEHKGIITITHEQKKEVTKRIRDLDTICLN